MLDETVDCIVFSIVFLLMKQVVPFTPSAGVLEWVNGTVPLGEYLIGRSVILHFMQFSMFDLVKGFLVLQYSTFSMRNGGAHGRYGVGDWTFLKCRQHMAAVSTTCF